MTCSEIRLPTDAEVSAFRRDGVVHLRAALPYPTVATLEHEIERLVANIATSDAGYDLEDLAEAAWGDGEQIDYGHAKQYDLELFAGWLRHEGDLRAADDVPEGAPRGAFLLDTGCWRRSEAIASLALDSRMGELVARLLDSDTVAYFDDQMFVKRPGTRQRTEWHQDYGFFHIEGTQGLVVWAPVDRADAENGAMRYVRGSHLTGDEYGASMFVSRTLMPGAQAPQVPDIEANPDAYDLVSFDVEPGDVVVHHIRTLHAAGANRTTDRQRRVMSLRYVGDDMRYRLRPGAPFPPHLRHALKDGDALWCEDYPIVHQKHPALMVTAT